MNLFAELRRRNVFRAAGAYVAISWLILQVAEVLLPAFDLEDRVLRTVLIVLGVGFIPAIVAAWAFELTPSGLVRDADIDRSSAANQRLNKRFDRALLVVLALALAYFALDKFLLDPARDLAREQAVAEAAASAALAGGIRQRDQGGPAVLAVLPFTAVGADEDSGFFAAGVHDDLLTRLAKLGSLRVISRTSVLEYRDTTMNIRDIGRALGADAILEGGVQAAGNRIRINAQLIEAASDEHLWAETYDRELTTTNIFEVQADISRAITVALQATMDDATADGSPLVPTENMAAYRAFHEAMTQRNNTHGAILTERYQSALRRAVELDPGFTRAAAELVGALSFANFNGRQNPESLAEAEALLDQIRSVAAGSAEYLIAQSYYTYYVLKDYDLAHEIISRAHQRAPSDLDLLSLRSWIERRQGDFASKLETHRLQRVLAPEAPRYSANIVSTLAQLHRYDEALAEADAHAGDAVPIAIMQSILRLQQHGDPKRLARELETLSSELPRPLPGEDIAEQYLLAREYARALEILNAITEPYDEAGTSHFGIETRTLLLLQLYWFQDQREAVERLLPQAVADYQAHHRPSVSSLLGEALLEVLAGQSDNAQRIVARWLRESHEDPAERAGAFSFACQILGLANAPAAAVDCLRRGLVEPSYIAPFLDPGMPHYDGVRRSPEFRALLAELQQ